MRKLKLQVQITADGFIGGPRGEMDWAAFPWTNDIETYVDALLDSVDTIVLGRKLAQGFIPYWASVAENPDHPEYTGGLQFTGKPKVVFTKTLAQSDWANTVLATGDLVAEITNLKNQTGKDLYACGGASFVSALIKHDLIDEYHLFVNPVAIGRGLPIFAQLDQPRSLKLVGAKAFDCGIVVLNYTRIPVE